MGFADDHSGGLSFVNKMKRDLFVGVGEDIYKACYMKGQFKLRSGQITDEYFDKYQFECSPSLLSLVCNQFHYLIQEKGLEFHVLAGLEMGGIPIATLLAYRESSLRLGDQEVLEGCSLAFVRKKAKEYGTCRIVEGESISGRICLIVEDVVTTGGQIIASAQEMRKEGAFVKDVICVIDREQGAEGMLRKEGLTLHSLYTMTQLKEYGNRE